MTDRRTNPQTTEGRRREAERVEREHKDDLPSRRDSESPEGGRPPRGTEWERRGPKGMREY